VSGDNPNFCPRCGKHLSVVAALTADLARVTAERNGLRERIDAVREQMPRGESCFACRGALSVLAACAPPASDVEHAEGFDSAVPPSVMPPYAHPAPAKEGE
jgi:hypothetical protein